VTGLGAKGKACPRGGCAAFVGWLRWLGGPLPRCWGGQRRPGDYGRHPLALTPVLAAWLVGLALWEISRASLINHRSSAVNLVRKREAG